MVIKNYYWKDTTNDLGIIHREFIIDDKIEKFDKKKILVIIYQLFNFEIICDISSEKFISFLNSLKKTVFI